MRRVILWGTLLLTVGLFFPNAAQGDFLYWNNFGKIQRANLDTMEIEPDVLPDVEYAGLFDIDPIHGKIYWVLPSEGIIRRASLDGSEIEDIVTGLERLWPITVDAASGKVYWGDYKDNHGGIARANLDGSMPEDVTRLISPNSIAIDSEGGYAYCTGVAVPGTGVYRVRLDGSGVEVVTLAPKRVTGVALDPLGEKVYWADQIGMDVPGKIQRANYDGTDPEDILTDFIAEPLSLSVDASGGKLYWSDALWETVYRASLDGTDVEILFSDVPVGGVRYVATAVPEPSSVFLLITAAVALSLCRFWRRLAG